MADIDKKLIQYLTRLSRIKCSEDEQESLLKDLRKILNYIEQLNEVNTENVAPCSHVLEGICNVMRDDVVDEILPRELFLANAPSHTGGMIRVPPILKNN